MLMCAYVCAPSSRHLLAVMPSSVPAAGDLGCAFSVRLLVDFAMLMDFAAAVAECAVPS